MTRNEHRVFAIAPLRHRAIASSCHRTIVIVSSRHHIIVIVLSHQHYRRVLFEVDEADIIYCDIIGKNPHQKRSDNKANKNSTSINKQSRIQFTCTCYIIGLET